MKDPKDSEKISTPFQPTNLFFTEYGWGITPIFIQLPWVSTHRFRKIHSEIRLKGPERLKRRLLCLLGVSGLLGLLGLSVLLCLFDLLGL